MRYLRSLILSLVATLALLAVGCDGGSDPCDGVTCSGHGRCVASGSSPRCVCDPDYRASGLWCVVAETDGDADVDGDGDADGDVDADADEDRPPAPGPMTLVALTMDVSTARICDLDGDGLYDNAVADLGEDDGAWFAMALSALINTDITRGLRLVAHFPHVDDRSGPEDDDTVMIFYGSGDPDDPPDPTDDFEGDEAYPVYPSSFDSCGEPRFVFTGVTLDDGSIHATGGHVPVFLFVEAIPAQRSQVVGNIGPGGQTGELNVCGCLSVEDLGGKAGIPGRGDYTLLETILIGGGVLGRPDIPGLTPDVDLDGDGLESFLLDADGYIESCIDGDRTTISGRDCWSDPRMIDGISMVLNLDGAPARHGGLIEGWEGMVDGSCTDPPEESLWDPR